MNSENNKKKQAKILIAIMGIITVLLLVSVIVLIANA